MRSCFYHTDLGQNAVFHNFAIQSALIQYSAVFRTIDRSTRGVLAKQLKKFPKSPSIYGQPVLTFAERAVVVFE